ncbi:MAG: decaprenyl-phosphate phosphoribosyltransferase [Abditibacteriota bacterium]|nr:decaprenyl-phosphate phosphoribosyltransferase [Abditibacteriota bacterium]
MNYIKLLRPTHYIKNLLIFVPLVFAEAFRLNAIIATFLAFIAFCLIASCVYIINDIVDYEKDKTNPHKCHRPIASGKVSKKRALGILIICFLLACLLCLFLPIGFNIALGVYAILNICYIFKLKDIVIIDVLCLSISFVLRIIAGGFAAGVEVTKWILVTCFFLALFLGFAKRRGEIVLDKEGLVKRKVAMEYSLNILDKFIIASGMLALICYALFTLDMSVIEKFQAPHLFWTIPLPVYGIFKYIMIIPQKENTDPTHILFSDKTILLCIVLWLILTLSIMHFGI